MKVLLTLAFWWLLGRGTEYAFDAGQGAVLFRVEGPVLWRDDWPRSLRRPLLWERCLWSADAGFTPGHFYVLDPAYFRPKMLRRLVPPGCDRDF